MGGAEFAALCRLWGRAGGVAVPYPVQLLGTELMLEFIGEPTARPRRGWPSCGPTGRAAPTCGSSWSTRWRCWPGLGCAHGDLSPYNLLVHGGRLVMIDLPQVVDVVANPQGAEFLARDVARVGRLVHRPRAAADSATPVRAGRRAGR